MRIRTYRLGDIPALAQIQELAASVDHTEVKGEQGFEEWLDEAEIEATANVFVVTDDDDEINEWGQGESLEGIEGEIIGYTALRLLEDEQAYHFLCEGVVHPQHRRRNAGRALLICALNRARIWAAEFELEAEEEGRPIYFEAALPSGDPGSEGLATKNEMWLTDEFSEPGMRVYRRDEL